MAGVGRFTAGVAAGGGGDGGEESDPDVDVDVDVDEENPGGTVVDEADAAVRGFSEST